MNPSTSSAPTVSVSVSKVSLGKALKKLLVYIILFLNLVATGFPVVWMFMQSFKTNTEYYANPWGLPKDWLWSNFGKAWEYGIKQYMFNSLYITILTVIGLLLVASSVSFYMARRPFRGSNVILLMFLFGMMIPVQSILIPLYLLMNKLHLTDTFFALFFPYIAGQLPMAVYLMTGYFRQIPKGLDEAAMIDGCSIYRVYWNIYLPISRPILSTVTILSTFGIWNEFILPLVMVNEDYLKPLPIGLMTFRGGFGAEYAVTSAALVLATVPIIILYLFLQKYIEKGMTAGAIKG